jgi:hypothetical protein
MEAELDRAVADDRVALRFVGARARFDDEKCARARGSEHAHRNSVLPPQDPEPQTVSSLVGHLGFHPSCGKP